MLKALIPLLLAWFAQSLPAQIPSADDEAVRTAVQQYYDAQAARDPDRALSFWSAAANPRMTRDTFLALFGPPAEDQISVEIRSVAVDASEARVRVLAVRTRLEMQNGRPLTSRTSFANSQTWRKEAAGWKLLRDMPFGDELADQYLAAAPGDRPPFIDRQSVPDRAALRYAISQRASMAAIAKDFPRAKSLFGDALDVSRAIGDRRGEANSFHNIAQADYFLRDFAGATEAYERELAVGRETDDQNAAAAALFGLASVDYARADYTPALARYRDALVVYEKNDDGSSIGRTVVSIGNIQYLQADYDQASASYRRGLTVLLASGDTSGAAFARRGLARVLAAQGDIASALEIYGQVLAGARAAQQADPRLKSDVASALESVGELYYRIGNTDRARASYEEAKSLDADDPDSAGRVLASLGMTELVAGRFDAAFAAYSESRARFETAKNPDGMAHAWVGIGFSQTAREKFADAIAAYRRAIALFEQKTNEDGVARAWLGLSMAQSGAGDDKAALESAGKVAAIAERTKNDDLVWRGAERTGEALRKLNRLDEARQAYQQSIAALDRLAADAPLSAESRGVLGDSATVWAGLALTLATGRDPAGALAAMESRRAHMRRVDFAAFQKDIAPGATADELADEQAIVREIISTRAQLRAETQAARSDAAGVTRLRDQLAALTAKRAERQERLYARLPDLAMWRGLPQPSMDAATLSTLVPGANGLIVAYLVTDSELLAVTVARGETGPDVTATAVPFNRREFAETLATAMQPGALQNADEWRARAAPVAAALLDPVASRLEGRDRIVIIPDDLLWKVPFEALPRGDSDLASTATVTYGTSLATLALQHRASATTTTSASASASSGPEPPKAGVIAAPAIPDAIRAPLALALPSWQPQEPGASLAAAQAAATPYGEGTRVLSGADATETAMRALLGAVDVVHAQVPLQVSGATPLLSSLLLAATGEAASEDGRFEARDLFSVAGRARIVVLPDGSAFGAAGVGNAIDPIAWAASAAGVSALVLGRWPLEAFESNTLVTTFHGRLATGASAMAAWQAAIAAAREKGAAPSGWAGLRIIGGG